MSLTFTDRLERCAAMFADGWDRAPDYLRELERTGGNAFEAAEWLVELAEKDIPIGDTLAAMLDGTFSSPTIMQPDDAERRLFTLAEHLGESPDDLREAGCGPYGHGVAYSVGRQEYAILTDGEADAAWEDSLDSYLDNCVLPELPETAQHYFDREAWKRDARHDGRGHSLSPYDGNEDDAREFYVYRMN